ncbi:conserved Plasmodium protein, unknown function [Plasmodium ovale curtisi]|uniref:Uncharacterized protein n=1 Tax=Plasmodium ovale curtisi TaxID=864141 RepID=A0A1A8VRK3_PLAOA|nr:conserved Plasmodium protein, unknown function [Plasmodium ovale curtisi]SBS94305.1 conserved Plasmodium protein, unknown function [Plasmodium ovale curtisi]
MEKTQFKYFLKGKIDNIFEKYNRVNVLSDMLGKEGDIENGGKEEYAEVINNHPYENSTNEEDEYWQFRNSMVDYDIKNSKRNMENTYFNFINNFSLLSKPKFLIVENYTSIIYENCEDKINVILANESIIEGKIEIQVKGKESYMIPCNVYMNVLSCFFPQLERGIYHLFFFVNKEMIFIKLLFPGMTFNDYSKSLPLHVIEIKDFGYCVENKWDKNTKYNISVHNNVYTNRELLKMYNNMYKNYTMISQVNRRNIKIGVGKNYKLEINNDEDFYDFLKSYKDIYTNHSFRNKNNNIHVNNVNFISQLNLEGEISQSRIPILYKKLLYDNCIYKNKMIIMYFHSVIFEYNPFNVLSVHIFTKDELKDGYTIFAFNLIPILNNENEKMEENSPFHKMDKKTGVNVEEGTSFNILKWLEKKKKNKKKKKKSYLSTLLMFHADEDNCADVRLWNYIRTIVCVKNGTSSNFYINRDSLKNDIQCPVPPELINNKNVFRKYAEGLKISEQVSIFFEKWNDDVLPVQKFVHSSLHDLSFGKMERLSNLVKSDAMKNEEGDILLLHSFHHKCEESENERGKHQTEIIEKGESNNSYRFDKIGCNEKAGSDQHDHNGKGEENLEKRETMECLHNSFVSFVFIVNGKIFQSVFPINKILLLFVINYWMHFVDEGSQ